ncbi:galactosyldiacylglycerol synthase [Kouleothrix aurantiaca]|uniref:Galactosyldiacylglycerol synthase n=1 Tax=Kouleothrix aurantiaca TaxID=186479 RepID=A0A0P9HC13_9CHLR|nr:galactosyldiacylglycerol synthase [Kouleothrix aurantiaca]
MPRILILHASVGSGHQRAAAALAAAFARKPGCDARVEDTLDYGSRVFRRAYSQSYRELSERAPALWRLFYQGTNISDPEWVEVANRVRSLVERPGVTGLARLLARFAPDAIVCTHFLPVELLLRLKRRGALPPPIYCVVTDVVAHCFWAMPGIDGYFVASDVTREQLITRGVAPAIIHISGIPIDPAIAGPKSPAEMRARYGFAIDRPLISLFGGGMDAERVRLVVEGLLARDIVGTLAVIAGRNTALSEERAGLGDGRALRLRALGQISYVDDIVTASDLVISKAGGLIVSEALGRGTPLMLVSPIPGQEEWNADYVVSAGAGMQLRMIELLPLAVERLLAQPERLGLLRRCAQAAGRPRAAIEIAEAVLCDLRAELISRPSAL